MAQLDRISYALVEDACKRAPMFQEQRDFNTAQHFFEEIDTVIPNLPHYAPTREDWIIVRPWLDLIVRSQRLNRQDVHSFKLSRTFINSLDFIKPRAFRLGYLTDDDMDELTTTFPEVSNEGEITKDMSTWYFFARLDTTSMKDSSQGRSKIPGHRDEILPLQSLHDLFLRLLTSDRAMGAMHNYLHEAGEEDSINLYLFPFNADIKSAHEYRVFCPPGGRIAAISQYGWHQRWIYADCSVVEQQLIADKVLEECQILHNEIIREPAMTKELNGKGYVFDVFFEPTLQEIRLIELNNFGARTGCGSCLFHWIKDAKTLYGRMNGVEMRVAV